MAVRFDNNSDWLDRTGISSGAFTLCGWFRIVTDTNDYATIVQFNDDYRMTLGSNGTVFQLYNGTSEDDGTNLSTGIWYHLAMTATAIGGGTMYGYLNGVQDTTLSGSGTTTGNLAIGQYPSDTAEQFDGRVFALKSWTAALSAAELAQEMYSITPVRQTNKYSWWPMFPGSAERLRDYSGDGRSWTEHGTLTDENSPPIVWTVAQPYCVAPSVGVVTLNQEGFRFFADDGSEGNATALALQDTNITRAKSLNTRPRILVDATGDPDSAQYQVEWKKSGDADSEYQAIQ